MRLSLALGMGLLTFGAAACASYGGNGETTSTMGGTVAPVPADSGLSPARDSMLPVDKPVDSAAVKPVDSAGVVAADSAAKPERPVAGRDADEQPFRVMLYDSDTTGGSRIELVIDYAVPDSLVDHLDDLDVGLTVNRESGELSARCERQGLCILALNAANDIVRGGKSVEQARADYADARRRLEAGVAVPESERLRFDVKGPDPDKR